MHAIILFMEKIPPIFFEAHCCLQVLAKLAAYKKGIVVWHLEKGPLRYILKQKAANCEREQIVVHLGFQHLTVVKKTKVHLFNVVHTPK